MQGGIGISYQTEPSYFAAEAVGSLRSVVVVARDTVSGEIVGVASCSYRRLMVDGDVRVCGYLGGLRGLPDVRGGTLLARGFRFLRGQARDAMHPLYLTSILDSNEYAKGVLAGSRAGLPRFEPVGRMAVFMLPLRRPRGGSVRPPWVVRGPNGNLLSEATSAINEFNAGHQFAAHYEVGDLAGESGLLGGFGPGDLYVYRKGSRVEATLGVWDLRAVKQWVVTRYPWRYRLIAPIWEVGSWLGLTPRLPRVGRSVDLLYASFATYTPGHEARFIDLVDAVASDWSGIGASMLAVGVPDRCPVAPMLEDRSVDSFTSTVYQVYWPGEVECPPASTRLPPNLEIATL
jgi:hypothetical protein